MKNRRLVLVLGGGAFVLAGLVWWRLAGETRPPATAAQPATAPGAVGATPAAEPVGRQCAEAIVTAPAVVSASATPATPAAPAAPAEGRVSPLAAPAVAAPAVAEEAAEVAATARMYAAHAPLREPEVADPDSESNRCILQTMVIKALFPGRPVTTATP